MPWFGARIVPELSMRWVAATLLFIATTTFAQQNPWYKSSIIYTLDVEVFKDSNGDGVGDFNGLISRLGYIDSLGADVIWLAPFQPTPNQDDGYDISDFYNVDPRLGTMNDFLGFMKRAKDLGIRVIIDLVVNHTSNQHPWFKDARTSPQSPYRPWYVWSKDRPANYDEGMVFPGVQKDIWSYDTLAGEYYYHRFYWFQPDLNTQHKPVWDEIKKIISFWMEKGVSGFRLDGVPFVIEVPQKKGTRYPHQFNLLTDMRQHAESINPEAVILGEANVLPREQLNFFGNNGDGIHMMFNFFVNQHIFYSLAARSAGPLKDALNATKSKPPAAQWAQFLRNHDEVDLGRLSNKERQQVYDDMGPSKNMQLYDRGIRRRLAPMLKDDSARIRMAYSLLLSLPSTPVIRYGDETGMGDDLSLKERLSVRTPMQWDHSRNAGFSSAQRTVRPVISQSPYDSSIVNVKDQEEDSASLLNWMRKMIALRKKSPAIALGSWEILNTGTENVLAILYRYQDDSVLVIHNFSDKPQSVKIKLPASKRALDFDLPGYGYRWIRDLTTTPGSLAKNRLTEQ
jgi:maltose alpha-D-glucosyltransferase/alpha-amylase